MARGHVVVLDRYYYSSMAYQGVRGVYSPEEVHRIMTAFAPVPDAAVFLDIPVELAIARIEGGRGEALNLMEKKDNLQRVRDVFASINLPEWIAIDASGSPDEVFSKLLDVLRTPLKAAGVWPKR
jgi:dTMP kinase